MSNRKSVRGRPKQDLAAAEEKKLAIVEVARKLFQEQGVEAVSMRKIASGVGVSPMTLYQYFENKSQLLHFIWEEFFTVLFGEIEQGMSRCNEPNQKLRVACTGYLDYWFRHPDHFRMVFLNEDRAEQDNQFFLQHAEIEERMNALFLPAMQACFPVKPSDELLAKLQLLMCVMNGIALNLITISEYEWPCYTSLLECYLDQLFSGA